MTPYILITEGEADYELIDSGDGEKLERFGAFVLSRPDPQVIWPKSLPAKEWLRADADFSKGESAAKWSKKPSVPASWSIRFAGLSFLAKLGAFKHTGLFPEQRAQWEFMRRTIRDARSGTGGKPGRTNEPSVLNLFAYTGGATMACLSEGASVTHVDASPGTVRWAQENMKLSKLEDASVRFIVEDALVFAKKELKRGKKYDAIIMDPPAFGRGAKGEIWKIDEKLPELLDVAAKLLSDEPLFVVLNGYSAGYSAVGYANALEAALTASGAKGVGSGTFESGELALRESGRVDGGKPSPEGRLLPAGIFARWKA